MLSIYHSFMFCSFFFCLLCRLRLAKNDKQCAINTGDCWSYIIRIVAGRVYLYRILIYEPVKDGIVPRNYGGIVLGKTTWASGGFQLGKNTEDVIRYL